MKFRLYVRLAYLPKLGQHSSSWLRVFQRRGRGTTANASGRYSISVPGSNAVLLFGFVGFTKDYVAVSPNAIYTTQGSMLPCVFPDGELRVLMMSN